MGMPAAVVENLEVRKAFEQLRAGYRANPNPGLDERRDWLERLERTLVRHKDDIVEAVDADFGGRARHETLAVEVYLVLDCLREAHARLEEWMAPRKMRPHRVYVGASPYIETVPLGVVGILSPWNYPVNLALGPLVSVLAAGNRALIKPSELTPRTSAVMGRLIRAAFSAEEVAVVEGGVEVARAVNRLPFDHLIFTGSSNVAREVARAAADHLVPVTLELGGKAPCYVHPDYPTAKAAESIAFGKLFNGGQTCVAPDYALVHADKEQVFVDAFRAWVKRTHPDLLRSPKYTALASDRGLQRMEALLEDAKAKGAVLEVMSPGGELRGTGRRLAPVVLRNTTPQMRVRQEELFGPLLPLIPYRTEDEAMEVVAALPRPLAAYVFDRDEDRAKRLLSRRLVSGGACINDTVSHFVQETLPFGGIGESGTGAYHGHHGYLAFSHERGVLVAGPIDAIRLVLHDKASDVIDKAIGLATTRMGKWFLG